MQMICTGVGNISGLIRGFTKVNGRIIKWMGSGRSNGPTGGCTLGIIKLIKNKEKECISGQMVRNLSGIGRTGNRMATGCIFWRTESVKLGNGVRGRESDG